MPPTDSATAQDSRPSEPPQEAESSTSTAATAAGAAEQIDSDAVEGGVATHASGDEAEGGDAAEDEEARSSTGSASSAAGSADADDQHSDSESVQSEGASQDTADGDGDDAAAAHPAAAAAAAAAAEDANIAGTSSLERGSMQGAGADAVDSGLQQQQQQQQQQHDAMSAQASSSGFSSSLNSRPVSAAQQYQLRGSRPCLAAIAAQIEGFEADFLVDTQHHMLLDGVPEDARSPGAAEAGPSAEELAAAQQAEAAALLEVNEGLQHRARQVLEQCNKGRPALNKAELGQLDGADARYRSALKTWQDLRKEQERVAAQNEATISDMKERLEGRMQRAQEVADTLARFKHEVALAAEDGRTGRPLPCKVLTELEDKERALDKEVQGVRLKNIHLNNALRKLEATMRSKEQLAEGLHMIDFEQLKIENQSLNEKIEERNEELLGLRKKTTLTVQILTHMKAKLAFVEGENAAMREELGRVEAALAGKRDELAAHKAKRDRLRQQEHKLKEGSVFVTAPMLLQDMQAQKEKRDELLGEIELMRQQLAAMGGSSSATGGSRGLSSSAAGSRSAAGRLQGGVCRGPGSSRSSRKAATPSLHVGMPTPSGVL